MSDLDRLYGPNKHKTYPSPLMVGFGVSLLLMVDYDELLEAGTKPLDAVYDEIHSLLLKADQTEQLTALLKAWVS